MPVTEPLAVVLIPGLLASARLYAEQIPALWRTGAVTVADHTRDDSMPAIARRILAGAPQRFALVGLSMGGYIGFEILRQAPERVVKLALLDTTARPDTPEQSAARRAQMALASSGRLEEVVEAQFVRAVHVSRRADAGLRALNRLMAEDVGSGAFLRQQTAVMGRIDSRPTLSSIHAPTLVLVGRTMSSPRRARRRDGARHCRGATRERAALRTLVHSRTAARGDERAAGVAPGLKHRPP